MAKIFELNSDYWAPLQGSNITVNGKVYTVFDYVGLALGSNVKITRVADTQSQCGDINKRPMEGFGVKSEYWAPLVYWGLTNDTVAARYLLTLVLPVSALKTSYLTSVFGTSRARMIIPVNNYIYPIFASAFVDNIQLISLNANVAKNFSTVFDSTLNGASLTLRIFDNTGVQDQSNTQTVKDGAARFTLTPSEVYSGGYLQISGVAFARTSYTSILNRDITIQEVWNAGIFGYVDVAA